MKELAAFFRRSPTAIGALIAILALGIVLRAWPSNGFRQVGYDEGIYSTYVGIAQKEGVWNFGNVVRAYVQSQAKRPDAFVPATRVGFLIPATVIAETTRLNPLVALRCTSLIASILLLLATAVIGFRLGGIERMLLLSSLIAIAPLQIHLAQRSLIDGYFAFWAVLCAWFLWENLETPRQKGWLAAYGLSLFVLVLTKENAAFVFVALVGVALVFAFLKLGRVNLSLMVVTVVAPLLAVLFLAMLIGGVGEWVSFYRGFVQKSAAHSFPVGSQDGAWYRYLFQDGAWYRYLVDFTLLSPCIVILAIGALFQLRKDAKADIFWALFLGTSFVAMSSVTYAMSLRFAAFWDVPLRWLAASQILYLVRPLPRKKSLFIVSAVVLVLIAVDLFQYWRYFVQGRIYDPVSYQLLHASKLIK